MEICSKLRMFLSWLTAVAILHMNHRAQSDQVSRFLHRALNNQNCPGFAVLMVWDEPVGVSDTEREHTDAWDSWCSESHKNPKTRIMLCHAVLGTLEQMFRGEQGEAHNRWFYITRCCKWVGRGRQEVPTCRFAQREPSTGTSRGKERLFQELLWDFREHRSCTDPFRSISPPGHCRPGPHLSSSAQQLDGMPEDFSFYTFFTAL